MISVAEAHARILADVEPLEAEAVALNAAHGRVLAENIVAQRTHPAQDISAMDGYAVRAQDLKQLPTPLDVIEDIPAGTIPRLALHTGQAARIFTGAPLPQGADTIVLQEDVDGVDTPNIIVREIEPQRHVRKAGLDFTEGQICLRKGTRLTAADIGLAAAAGLVELPVHKRPSVALLSTGNELVLPGTPLNTGQIVSSNGVMLSALVERFGGTAQDLGIARDTQEEIKAKAAAMKEADIGVTIGGASVGKHDLVQSVLSTMGLEVDFWKIAMRPGKPLIFGRFNGKAFLGLPGNPVSAFVCALLFLRPLIRKLSGEIISDPLPLEEKILSGPLGKNGIRMTFLRAKYTTANQSNVAALPVQDSSMLSALSQSDCLIVRDVNAEPASAGDIVHVLPLS